ncbi:solute carrier family 52, riboflavin transporter, member 3-A isoform X3 [Anabrus simplex]|uniref:solute carrier family 52, riboflavin transporter, member 3-A isoform X3 n=1 Tax=Anabrus simplex TaxID=316456 RepID=UPI0034DD3458
MMVEASETTSLLSKDPHKVKIEEPRMRYFAWCSCRRKLSDRKLLVDVLAILFGIAAWVAVNGMFVQLPLLVQTQPEEWNLPSYLSVIVQIGNIGPILYTISHKFFPGRLQDSHIIYCILIMGSTALLLMAFLYKETTIIAGEPHSTSLFCLQFFISLVGCTSSVLFMPFMSNFREIYLISYFVGEGLSGFLPSIMALVQGVGGNPSCVNRTLFNETTNSTVVELVLYTPPPRFSPEVFFFFLFGVMSLSTIAFFLLNNLRICKSEKVSSYQAELTRRYSNKSASPPVTQHPPLSIAYGVDTIPPVNLSMHLSDSDIPYEGNESLKEGLQNETQAAVTESVPSKNLPRPTYGFLLALAAWVCIFGNGVFPSIQSYSCLPYGNTAYHLSATLSSMANPMACFLAFFIPYNSLLAISILTAFSTLISAYIGATALLSPSPPLVGTMMGETLVVLSWVLFTGLISYIKVSIASLFRREPGRALFWCGAVQQMGSAFGAIVTFFLVNYTHLFTSYTPSCG